MLLKRMLSKPLWQLAVIFLLTAMVLNFIAQMAKLVKADEQVNIIEQVEFTKLCDVPELTRSNRDAEAVSYEDTLTAINWYKEHNLDAVLSIGVDVDTPLMSDGNGNWLTGDILGLLSADALNIEALGLHVCCNTAIEKSKKFIFVEITKIHHLMSLTSLQT